MIDEAAAKHKIMMVVFSKRSFRVENHCNRTVLPQSKSSFPLSENY